MLHPAAGQPGTDAWGNWVQETLAAAPATYAPLHKPAVYGVPLYAYGTSYTNGANASDPATNSFVALTAAALGASATHNRGTGGSNTPSMPAQYMAGTDLWTPGVTTGVAMMEAGIGEALGANTTTEPQSRAVFVECLQTALRWFRAKEVRTFDHASVALGTFSFSALTGTVITGRGVLAVTAGQTFTITPGGPSEIVLLTAPWRAIDAEVENSDFEVQVDGGPWRAGTTKGRGDVRATGVAYTFGSYRVTGLTPTSVVIVRKKGTGDLWFLDRYLVMGNPTPPAVILVQDCPLVDASVSTDNLVGNGSFEVDTALWTVSAGSTLATSTAAAKVGAKSMVCTWGTGGPIAYTAASVVAGRSYTFSLWAFVPAGQADMRIAAWGAVAAEIDGDFNTTKEAWTKLSISFTANATGNVFLSTKHAPADGSITYIDDVRLTPSTDLWYRGAGYGDQASNTIMEIYRALVRQVAASAEFNDGAVVVADPAPYWNPAIHVHPDTIHPNDLGHAIYGDAISRAVQTLVGS